MVLVLLEVKECACNRAGNNPAELLEEEVVPA